MFKDLINSWPYLISGLCSILLLVIIITLVVSKEFRSDLIAKENKASMLGLISIEGAIVLVLCALFFVGMMYPIVKPHIPFDTMIESRGYEFESPSNLLDAYENILKENESLNCEVSTLKKEMKNLIDEQKTIFSDSKIYEYIKTLSPSSKFANRLKQLQKDQDGPWAIKGEAVPLKIQVPSITSKDGISYGVLSEGVASSCPLYHKMNLELVSALTVKGKRVSGICKVVYTKNLLHSGTNCEDIMPVDLHISCEDASSIFSSDILTCDKNGVAKWNLQNKPDNGYVVQAVIINSEKDSNK